MYTLLPFEKKVPIVRQNKAQKISTIAGKLVIVIFPLLVAGLIALVYSIKTGLIPLPVPIWNDEAAYYELIKTWLATRQPLGFWGFDGGHAILGTGSAWSPAILIPYALFGMMFSWNTTSVFFANILFLCFANLIFLLLVNPRGRYIWRILLVQATSVIVILYTTTCMSEPFRFSLAIILAGVFYKLIFGESTKIFKYVIAPVFILFTIQVYIFMAFCVPIYIFAIMKESGLVKKIIAAFFAMAVVAVGSYYLLHLISSNYNIYKTERLFNALKNLDIAGAIMAFLAMMKEGILSLIGMCNIYVGYGLFLWLVPFVLLTIIISFVFIVLYFLKEHKIGNWEPGRDAILMIIICYSMSIYLLMYLTVYSMERFTFLRGMGIVILFIMYLVAMTEQKKPFIIFVTLYAIGMLCLPLNLDDFMADRYQTQESSLSWQSLSKDWEQVFSIEDTKDPWENTVAVYTLEPKVIASIPAGMGVNMMMTPGLLNQDAEYMLFSLKENENLLRGDWLEQYYYDIYEAHKDLFENEYKEIYKGAEYIIYQKNE